VYHRIPHGQKQALCNHPTKTSITDLLRNKATLEIAVDTEYHHSHTLTIQTCCRLDKKTVAVQLYRSTDVPKLPADFNLKDYLPLGKKSYGRFLRHVKLRPVQVIKSSLSPVQILADLFGIDGLVGCSRAEGRAYLAKCDDDEGPPNADLHPKQHRWKIPAIQMVFTAHSLSADLGRMFGRRFYRSIFENRVDGEKPLALRDGRLLGLVQPGTPGAPVVEYARTADGDLYEIRLLTRDTNLPFGPLTLEAASKTFLGVGKVEALTPEDKQDMLRTFQEKTADAYGYAIRDVVNVLLVAEQMKHENRRIYEAFDCPAEDIPSMRPTMGSRIAQWLLKMTQRSAAAESQELSSETKLKALTRAGGRDVFTEGRKPSRYGAQTGKVHGGLLLNRSPTRFWHEAPAMLHDVDMSGCYNNVIARMNVYWGRPVVFEPGRKRWSLREAVEYVSKHADADAWYVRVTGDINSAPNALIPSSRDALTSENYRKKVRRPQEPGAGVLFSRRVESGVVTRATWLMIQALPAKLKQEYEALAADSMVFYPRKLVADSGPAYDKLVEQLREDKLPWEAELDLEATQERVIEYLDADYASLRFRAGEYARRIGEFRRQAQEEHGKGSGADVAWKLQANNMYGVLNCKHLASGNAVAANQITAMARAEAFAMCQALNAIQTITDGCSYARHQIPACTFAECLQRKPDYPIRRAEAGDGIPFLDLAKIPEDDAGFTRWYWKHVRRFFGLKGKEYTYLFQTHELVHKKTGSTGEAAFDALACDGCSDYIKCLEGPDGGWAVHEMAMRGYGKESKDALRDWVVDTYSTDCLEDLPPVTTDTVLLKVKEARLKARKVLRSGTPEVVFPLGQEATKVRAYRAIKASAFTFQTPEQYARIDKQLRKFFEKTSCGPEVLALRRTYRGKQQGSLRALAEEIYEVIQSGGRDLTKHMHLNRTFPALKEAAAERRAQARQLREEGDEALRKKIDVRGLKPAATKAAILCRRSDRHLLA
jgi:hypothetical protein